MFLLSANQVITLLTCKTFLSFPK